MNDYQEPITITADEELRALETDLARLISEDPTTWRDESGAWLGMLFDEAEQGRATCDPQYAGWYENRKGEIMGIWERTQKLATHIDAADGIATRAVAATQLAVNQRDEVQGKYAQLHEAINTYDTSHPLVADLVETAEEYASENLYAYYDETQQMGWYEIGVKDAAWDAICAIEGSTAPSRAELEALIAALTAYHDRLTAEAAWE